MVCGGKALAKAVLVLMGTGCAVKALATAQHRMATACVARVPEREGLAQTDTACAGRAPATGWVVPAPTAWTLAQDSHPALAVLLVRHRTISTPRVLVSHPHPREVPGSEPGQHTTSPKIATPRATRSPRRKSFQP